ncbi:MULTISPECIES: PAS domain S-box protein [Methylosinus]|uniref:histidine kinase n=1 Tax=Methylosinus trichosporium (strain ATCC 35070 / NCIMB 11131 / UNIQEM 75 / OB3b) TaxID=595536 RepID=A0A2D2D5N3_METT3|nr:MULTISPECIES: PAS domain S-box protein [Methylosinus]ATQ70318.1 PAS domain-containing sensor histidine kinase [Methylosinus trichosporium OB3b]
MDETCVRVSAPPEPQRRSADRAPRAKDGADIGRQSVERICRRLLEEMREGTVELDRNAVVLHCNRRFREMIGRPLARLIGGRLVDHVALPQRKRFAAFLAAGRAETREFEFARADGSLAPVSVALGPPTAGSAASRLAVITDLSQIKWMERSFAASDALREREKWLRLAVAAGRVGTFDADLVRGCSCFSATAHEILGLPAERAITLAEVEAMLLEDDRPGFYAELRAACTGADGGEWSHELRIRRADGALRWIALAGQFELRRSPRGLTPTRVLGTAIDVTERRETEESLRHSNERLRLALAAGAIGSWELDTGQETVDVDAKHREIFGLPAAEPILPDTVLDLIHPDDREEVRSAVHAALDPSGDGRYQAEYRIRRRADGAERWVSSRAQAFFDNPRAVRMIGVVSDVTEKKRTESELHEKARLAEQLAGVAASAPGLIASFRLAPDGKASLPYTSPNVEDVYGLSSEALREDAEIKFARVHPDDLGHVRASIAESARLMTVWRASYRYNHPRKGWVWIEAQSSPIREPDGSVLWNGYLQDVTERKRIEQALVDKEARLHATVEGAHDAIVTLDEQGAIRSMNSAAVRMFGYPEVDTIGRSIEALIPACLCGGRRSSLLSRVHEACAEEGAVCEAEGRRKDGAAFPVDLSVSKAAYHGRSLFIAFVRDLSERRRIEARMQKLHAERLSAVGELAAGLAHELNQPLSATTIYLRAARRLLQMPADQRPANVEDALDNAATQIMRAGQIICHLREFITRGEPDKTIQRLHELVAEANELVVVEAKQAGIGVVFQLNAPDDRILADRVQIKQVVVNLMRNAKDAMSSSQTRRMLVSTRAAGRSMIRVDVADTGSGLTEEARASLFEPFTTTKANGLGVGLTIARTIVEAHYGKIWAGPNRDGGATFSFTLPLGVETET